ncbi:DUF4192 family protein [Kitasatospora aureofaciens]|uniref:DUF4192 family protein n=1 Tax=Kitasatospora aureofaciens TaxID=1894 RepID=UPI000525D681|nr:DUF4192 family protein [Kitasatospora aureofaciens]
MKINTPPPFDITDPAQAVEALPYLLSYQPDGPDGMVFALIHEIQRDRPVFSQRFALPGATVGPREAADRMMHDILDRLEEFAIGPADVLLYLCAGREDAKDGYNAMGRYRTLADALLLSAEAHGVGTLGVMFVTATHWWAYHHRNPLYRGEGMPVDGPDSPGTVTRNARALGFPAPPSEAKIRAAFEPVTGREAKVQRAAIGKEVGLQAERVQASGVDAETDRAAAILDRLLLDGGDGTLLADLTPAQTAELIIALRHRPLRDIALSYTESDELARARELWELLARRCASADTILTSAPLTLAAFAAAVAGEVPAALIMLGQVRRVEPKYVLAQHILEQIVVTGSVAALVERMQDLRAERLHAREG